MKLPLIFLSLTLLALFVGCGIGFPGWSPAPPANPASEVSGPEAVSTGGEDSDDQVTVTPLPKPAPPGPPAPFIEKALKWLVQAQHESGGWGAGSHAKQNIRNPHKVQTDPATTAFTAMALLRVGHTPVSGDYSHVVRLATEYLVQVVSEAADDGPQITSLKNTQPQSKLGHNIDTSITLQYLSRVLTTLPDSDPLKARVDAAVDKCLAKLQGSQQKDGSWGGGTWAGVLQSSSGTQALEWAKAAGKRVDNLALDRARDNQKRNFDIKTRRAAAPDSAGVELYAFAGSQRAAASEAGAALKIIDEGKAKGLLAEDAACNSENLIVLGISEAAATRLGQSYALSQTQIQQLDDDKMLQGFGNNGGEEYLSYMLTSESLVIQGGEAWPKWSDKMHGRLMKIQSPDGSWTGHHCITSPVFCTAAVVQCLTADRDLELMQVMSNQDVAASTEDKTEKK